MVEKVRTAFYGKDLRVEIKKYPLSVAGDKIQVVSGGENHFMPDIGPNSFLEMPVRKKFLFFGPWVYVRTFFAIKKAKTCIDFFPDGLVYGPDPEQLKQANMAMLAKEIGGDTEINIPWYITVFLAFNTIILLILANILGVF